MDPYEILKISPHSNISQIKKAYYLLAKVYPPDKTQDSKSYDNFLDLKKAFEQLSNEQKRHQIDCFRLTQDAVVQDEVDIDDLEYSDGIFFIDCRCGGFYEINALDFANSKLSHEVNDKNQTFFAYCDSCSGACEINM